jgi:hypothetical protein
METTTSREPATTDRPPPIGEQWPEQGGIYVGIARGRDGAPDYHLVVADVEKTSIAWQPAMDWAEGLAVGGHRDFSLPTRPEQALLYANVGDLFAREWYWSSAQYAGHAGYAWFQLFDNGYQFSYGKSSELRARAVRRIPQ